ncbi:sensor histidine kinase [Knoellia sp. CPCC 206450]|uniref:sensor histidine kinase n=1 Tax=Knoellia tibetensis TaxID=3404798 RepID=UPI003B43A365
MPWDRDAERWGPPRRVPPGAWVVGPVVVALLQVVGSLGASRGQPAARDIDALGVALLLVGPVALALSRRWAVPCLVVSGLAVAVWLALGYPYGPVFAAYAVLTVVVIARGGRWVAWSVAGMVVAGQALRGWAAPGTGWSWAGTAGLLAWLLVALAVAEVVRGRRDRMVATIAARREERRRREGEERLLIAQELHDVVAHHMSLINVQAGVALHLAERRPESVEPALRAIRDASSEGLAELRSLVDVLRADHTPAPRTPAVRLARLGDLVERSRVAGLEVTVDRTGSVGEVPAAVDLAAYRIVQEAITNVVRHAHARRATVSLDHGADALTVVVEDDGRGADLDRVAEGDGLVGMRERARALGGSVDLDRSPLGGLRVTASVPVREGSST